MLFTFFDKKDVMYKEFVPEGQRNRSASSYVEVIVRLLKRISRARPECQAEGSWFLLHDNDRSGD